MLTTYKRKLLEQLARVHLCGLRHNDICLQCAAKLRNRRPWSDALDFSTYANGLEVECPLHGRYYPVCSRCHSRHPYGAGYIAEYARRRYPL